MGSSGNRSDEPFSGLHLQQSTLSRMERNGGAPSTYFASLVQSSRLVVFNSVFCSLLINSSRAAPIALVLIFNCSPYATLHSHSSWRRKRVGMNTDGAALLGQLVFRTDPCKRRLWRALPRVWKAPTRESAAHRVQIACNASQVWMGERIKYHNLFCTNHSRLQSLLFDFIAA